MGNPHGVVFVDSVADIDIEKIGPKFENHPIFPDRVNTLDQSTDNDEKTIYDKKIHYAIAKASGNVLIVNILDALSEVMDIFIFEMRREILRTEKRKGMLQEAHKQIVECLLKRDVVNGQKALMKHFDMIDNIIHKEL